MRSRGDSAHPPTLSNVVHQDTYCTDRDTIMDFKSNGIAGVQSVSQGGSGQSVKLPGGSWQVWVRGYNGGETKGFVRSDKLLTPSTGSSCDPIFPYDSP